MRILGIETSCDETSAAVVEETGDAAAPWAMRSNVIASQVPIHREWGGVVPELASRQHIRDICGVVERALGEAETTWPDLGAIAVTQGPGLVGSLLVGLAFTRWLNAPPVHLLAMAAAGNIAGQVGDLLESAYKRSAGVKDSGGLLPGHGGILDRIDALILAIPVVWYYWTLIYSPGM